MVNKIKTYIESDKIEWEFIGEGIKRKILGYDQELMMVIVDFQKGSIGRLHQHPHRQVSYIASGSFLVQIGDKKNTLKKGDSFFIPPDEKHEVTALEDSSIIDVFAPWRKDFIKNDL
jgi:quercetin dioxygenase-like cupin family protein